MLGLSFRETGSWFPRVMVFAFLLTVVTQAIRPMVSYRALALGGGALDLGIVAASYALLSLAVAVPLGRRVDRWGEPPIIVGGAVVILGSAVSLLFIQSIWAIALSQAALGLGQIMYVVGQQALIANGGGASTRDARYGLFTAVISLGQLVGPALGGVVAGGGTIATTAGSSSADTQRVFLVMSVLSTLALAVGLTLLWQPPTGQRTRRRAAARAPRTTSTSAMRQVVGIRSMPHAMVVSLTVLTSIDILAIYLPAYGEQNGLSVQMVGYLLAARAGASIASRLFMIPLIRALGRRWLLISSLAAPAAALLAFPLLPLPWQFVAMTVIGLGLGLGQPVTLSWVAGRAPTQLLGTALGLRLTGNRLGQVLVPVAVGSLTAATGVGAVFICLAAMLTAGAALMLGAAFEDGPREAEAGPPLPSG